MIQIKDKNTKLYEVDLYKPVKNYFTEQGYDVYGEVHDCDVVAVKDGDLIIIELKLRFNLELVMQAAKRQRLSEQVYVAIPRPTYSFRSRKWQDLCYLMRRLELGLIVISFRSNQEELQVIHHPTPFNQAKSRQMSKKRKMRLLAEVEGRTGDFNVGGSSQSKVITAYKETCIYIACCLIHHGPLSAKRLKEIGTGDKTSRILIRNFDEWFERIERGIYTISEKGKNDLKDYPKLVEHYMKLM